MARLFALVVLFLAGCAAEQQIPTPNEVLGADLPRAALVIGNGSYQSVASLRNPASDAGSIAGALQSAGYRVHKGGALVDLDRAEMEREIAAFAAEVSQTGGIAFVYYAGHGIQVDGRNYLIPVDAGITTTTEIPLETVDLQSLLSALEAPNIEMKVIVIDACRDNPFELAVAGTPVGSRTSKGDPGLRSLSSGLSELIAPPGALVAFATAPGSVALDGEGQNSPYAAALANVVGEPGLRVEDVFISVRNRVRAETSGAQVPWETSSLTSVAAFSGAARTAAEPASLFAEAPATSVWDGVYFAERRCGPPIGGGAYNYRTYSAYYPTIRQGRGLSDVKGELSSERLEWRFGRDGVVSVTGFGENRATRWDIRLTGRMENDAARMQGRLGSRDCELTIWRSTSPNNPLFGMHVLTEAEMREALTGNTIVAQNWKQYFGSDGETLVLANGPDGPNTELVRNQWKIENGAYCDNWGAPMNCRPVGNVIGKRTDDGWEVAFVNKERGRAWPTKVVKGRAL